MGNEPGNAGVSEVVGDLAAEHAALDRVVSAIDPNEWARPTPSPGWTIADQIGHLTFFDVTAALAISDPDGFASHVRNLMSGSDSTHMDSATLGEYRSMTAVDLLDSWREARQGLLDASAALADDDRVAWYGPSMGARSFLTARLMETWAHGQDIVDTLDSAGIDRPERRPTDRLRHIAQLGFITRGWSYKVRGDRPPEETVRAELTAPRGAIWTYGPADATDVVTGPAEDFCLVVTQRRNVADTALDAGPVSLHWLERAQAFAGGASDGPPAGAATVPSWRE